MSWLPYLTVGLMGVAVYCFIKARNAARIAAYYRGRTDEAIVGLRSGDVDSLFMVRDQITAALGWREAQRFMQGVFDHDEWVAWRDEGHRP